MKKPIAVLCSDLHLSLRPPPCRDDKDWMEVQEKYLAQLDDLAEQLKLRVFCAGDIFDKWNSPPELINFALECLPDEMQCIPGQHDLPNHRQDDVYRSAFHTLHLAGKIETLCKHGTAFEGPTPEQSFIAYGFGWDEKLEPRSKGKQESFEAFGSRFRNCPHLALVHKYMWINDVSKYPGAPEEARLRYHKKILGTYDAVVIGDNHKGWILHRGGDCPRTEFLNCGTFIRRKSDEIEYSPAIGLLYSDGTIERKYLDTSIDRFHSDPKKREELPLNLKEFIDGLEKLGEQGLDFREAVENYLVKSEDIDKETKQIILRALEGDNKA